MKCMEKQPEFQSHLMVAYSKVTPAVLLQVFLHNILTQLTPRYFLNAKSINFFIFTSQ